MFPLRLIVETTDIPVMSTRFFKDAESVIDSLKKNEDSVGKAN